MMMLGSAWLGLGGGLGGETWGSSLGRLWIDEYAGGTWIKHLDKYLVLCSPPILWMIEFSQT